MEPCNLVQPEVPRHPLHGQLVIQPLPELALYSGRRDATFNILDDKYQCRQHRPEYRIIIANKKEQRRDDSYRDRCEWRYRYNG